MNIPVKINFPFFEQNKKYIEALDLENIIYRPSARLKITNPQRYKYLEEMNLLKKLNFFTRRISNFVYTYVKNTEKLKDFPPDLLKENGGWITNNILEGKSLLKHFSPKFTAFFINFINNIKGKHVLYSWFKERYGLRFIHTLLTKCGIKTKLYSGDLSAQKRQEIINLFNSPENINGKIIKILLVTEAGAEGINLKGVNNIHILESSASPNLVKQVIGRVVRLDSHINLPPKKRYVNVWRYWSEPLDKNTIGIDETLYMRENETQERNNKFFVEKLIKNSI